MAQTSLRIAACCITLIAASFGSACRKNEAISPLRIAAASDLSVALPKIAEHFGGPATPMPALTFASSGKLAAQIDEGAPFEIFFSAGAIHLDRVIASGKCRADTRTRIGAGPLVMVTRTGIPQVTALSALTDPKLQHISIASPEHAPYGVAAKEAFTRAGIWSAVEARIVSAESVRQALAQVDRGDSDVAVVAKALVYERSPNAYWELPKDAYTAPVLEAIACGPSKEAERFLAYVRDGEGRRELSLAGFTQ